MTSPDVRDSLQRALGLAYTVEQELGGGGMSRVFVADEAALGRKVVVKVLRLDLPEGLSSERFKREVRLAARLQHPHVVPLLAAGELDGGVLYYTMPFVEGESLRARLDRDGGLPRTASCTGTSNPRTSCCRTAARWSPTSASPRRSAPRLRRRRTRARTDRLH
jgi:serine/threonine protein kinase